MQEINQETGEVFTMSESHAIMRYLARTRDCPDHWYSHDLRRRAKVDIYLDEHHNYLRQGCGYFVFKLTIMPRLFGV